MPTKINNKARALKGLVELTTEFIDYSFPFFTEVTNSG